MAKKKVSKKPICDICRHEKNLNEWMTETNIKLKICEHCERLIKRIQARVPKEK